MRRPALILTLTAIAFPAAAAEPPAPAKPQLICRNAVKTIGSRIRKPRRCMTAERWQEADEKDGRAPITMQVVAPNDGPKRSQ